MQLGNEVTIDGVKFVRADTLPKVLDTSEAHSIMRKAGILERYYAALDASKRPSPSYNAIAADRTRGELFIAICEWAKSNGADLGSEHTSKGVE